MGMEGSNQHITELHEAVGEMLSPLEEAKAALELAHQHLEEAYQDIRPGIAEGVLDSSYYQLNQGLTRMRQQVFPDYNAAVDHLKSTDILKAETLSNDTARTATNALATFEGTAKNEYIPFQETLMEGAEELRESVGIAGEATWRLLQSCKDLLLPVTRDGKFCSVQGVIVKGLDTQWDIDRYMGRQEG